MIEEVLIVAFLCFFVCVCVSFVGAYEIVSDDYSVESFSIGSVSEESDLSNFDSRYVVSPESGGYFEGDNVYGEVKKYPDEIIVEKEEATSSGGGGGGSSISGGGGGVLEYECLTNDGCDRGYSCVENVCVDAYGIEIMDFESPAKMGEYFDFTYSVQRKLNDTALLKTTSWIEDLNGNILTYEYGELQVLPFEKKIDSQRMFLPNSIRQELYLFHFRVDDSEITLIESRDLDVRIRGDYVYFEKGINWPVVIVSGFLALVLGVLAVIYNKKLIALWLWFKRKYLDAWIYRLKEIYWRIFNEK